MTERNMNIDPSKLNDASRLRAFADGEIPRVEAGTPDEAQVAFERALRDSVARVMGEDVRAPEALRQSVAAMFAAEAGADPQTAEEPAVVTTPMGDTTDRSFWSGARKYLGVAAVLALVVTLIGVGGSQVFFQGVPDAPFPIERVSDVRTFVPKAHEFSGSCDPETFANKFQHQSIADAVDFTTEYLEGLPADLSSKLRGLVNAGFVFTGLGECRVPGEGKSVHAYFTPSAGGTSVSVFIQKAEETGLAKMCEKHCFGASCDDASEAKNLYVWKCAGYLHYLYSPDAALTERARVAMDAPAKTAPLLR